MCNTGGFKQHSQGTSQEKFIYKGLCTTLPYGERPINFPLTLVLSWISKKDNRELSHMSHRELYENSLCHEALRDITHMFQEQCLLFQPAGFLISSNSTADRDSVNSALEDEDHDFYHHLQAATSFTNFEEESSFEECTLIPVTI